MTLQQAAEGITIQKGVYNIGFNGNDETQFDVRNLDEMEEIWEDFCDENDCGTDSVDYIEYVGPWEEDD